MLKGPPPTLAMEITAPVVIGILVKGASISTRESPVIPFVTVVGGATGSATGDATGGGTDGGIGDLTGGETGRLIGGVIGGIN